MKAAMLTGPSPLLDTGLGPGLEVLPVHVLDMQMAVATRGEATVSAAS